MNVFDTPNGHIILNHVQWVEPIRQTSNGYAIDVHLKGEICNLAFTTEGEAVYTLDELLRVLVEVV